MFSVCRCVSSVLKVVLLMWKVKCSGGIVVLLVILLKFRVSVLDM